MPLLCDEDLSYGVVVPFPPVDTGELFVEFWQVPARVSTKPLQPRVSGDRRICLDSRVGEPSQRDVLRPGGGIVLPPSDSSTRKIQLPVQVGRQHLDAAANFGLLQIQGRPADQDSR
jgi:hypothetical protein